MEKKSKILNRKQYVLPHAETYLHKLDIIENQYPPSPGVINCIKSFNSVSLYPHPTSEYYELLDKISNYSNCTRDQIILTNGSDNALKLILDAWSSDQTQILIPVPTYPHFMMFAETSLSDVITIKTHAKESPDSIMKRVGDVLELNKTIGMVYLASPNMPMGYVIEPSSIRTHLENFPKVLFIVDQAYVEYDGILATELLLYENIIITRTFSKAFGLAGLRIGYLMASVDMIDYMKRIVNDKNVTNLAVAAALAAMNDLDYYQTLMLETSSEKNRLRKVFKSIITSESVIYDYEIAGGNFYTLWSKRPAYVVEQFKEYGVYIRDKSSEIPDGVRIMVGRPDQNNDVIHIIKKINLQQILKQTPVLFDLDNTLRYGSRNNSAYEGIKVLNKYESHIATNNSSYTPEEIHDYLLQHGVNIPIDRIYSPLTAFKKLISADMNYCVLGHVSRWFPEGKPLSLDTEVVFYACDYFLTQDDYIILSKIGKKGAILYCSYMTDYTSIDDYPDTDYTGTELIPDMGSFVKIMNKFIKTQSIGKPDLLMLPHNFEVMVGDGMSDQLLAKAMNAFYIKITYEDCLSLEYYTSTINKMANLESSIVV